MLSIHAGYCALECDGVVSHQRGVPSRSDHEVRARACDQRIVERLKQVSDRWGVAEGGKGEGEAVEMDEVVFVDLWMFRMWTCLHCRTAV